MCNIPYEDNPRFLKSCNVVCPALSDGFCFLTAEVSACGLPVVTTNVGAHSERVIDEKTGILTHLVQIILQIL
ncbi:MAG: glycosyltransferase [Nitrososphaerales archaeon]